MRRTLFEMINHIVAVCIVNPADILLLIPRRSWGIHGMYAGIRHIITSHCHDWLRLTVLLLKQFRTFVAYYVFSHYSSRFVRTGTRQQCQFI